MQQQNYLRIWQLINPSNHTLINTSKLINWILNLINLKQQPTNKKSTEQLNKNLKKTLKLKKINNQQNNQKLLYKNINSIQNPKQLKQNQLYSNQTQQQQNLLKKSINSEIILEYIQKYIQTDQYKTIPKPKLQIATQDIKQLKQKQKQSPNDKKKTKSIKEKQIEEIKYDEGLISLSFQESIFFYYWFIKTFQQNQSMLKQSLINVQHQEGQKIAQFQDSQHQLHNNNQTLQQQNNKQYQLKYMRHLNQRQLIDFNQESFLHLKKHQPKLKLLFKHYAKLSHQFTKKIFTFDQANILQQMINLHQWMLFCKDWSILNAQSVNQDWTISKVNRQFLMDLFFQNSFFRKQMSFQMFQRALVAISSKMYQDCDINRSKPIDLLLGYLSIKNEEKFLENLDIKRINFSRSDLLICFKDKDRDVLSKVKIVRKIGNNAMQRSKSVAINKQRQISNLEQNSKRLRGNSEKKLNNENEFVQQMVESKVINPEILSSRFQRIRDNPMGKQKMSLSSKLSINRKSAPQIGVHLPTIQNNKFFHKITVNNHLNKFKQYITQQVPQSSSVLRNKITGYHKIYDLNIQNDQHKIKTNNKINHHKINKIISTKLQNIFQQTK